MVACWTSSFFSRALLVSIPNGAVAMLLTSASLFDKSDSFGLGVGQIWAGYNFMLGFLVVFRTNNSYSRFWQGAELLHQIRGEWFNAVSCLFAFSSAQPEKRQDVEHFQHLVVRLASMLHCAALQQITVRQIKEFETIEIDGMDLEALRFLQEKSEKTEVLLQWIQRLVVDAAGSGVLPIAPPILSRVFQELSRGIVNLNNARKITDVPFPHPYTTMIDVMLVIQWLVTPLVAALVTKSWLLAGTLSMLTVFSFWSTVHIAKEIENPFGDDPNDLPLVEYQKSFNTSLLTLLDERAQLPPSYTHVKKKRHNMSCMPGEWLNPAIDPNQRRKTLHERLTSKTARRNESMERLLSATIGTVSLKSLFDERSIPLDETLVASSDTQAFTGKSNLSGIKEARASSCRASRISTSHMDENIMGGGTDGDNTGIADSPKIVRVSSLAEQIPARRTLSLEESPPVALVVEDARHQRQCG